MLRPLPDGDLSGLTLSYQETRSNCIPMDSNLFATVDWPSLRVWANDGTGEKIYKVPLTAYSTPVEGQYRAATAQISLGGVVTAGDYVGFAFLDEHYSYQLRSGDTTAYALSQLVGAVQAFSTTMSATLSGGTVTLTYSRPNETAASGANGNRVGLYTYVSGAATEQWDSSWKQFSGGTSPTQWQVTLPFATLTDPALGTIPASAVRKLRWTYAADLQPGFFQRSEFQVVVQNWSVSGSGRGYSVAGSGSRRVEDNSGELVYSGTWATPAAGNFSGATISLTGAPGSTVSFAYNATADHQLYVGTRYVPNGATISAAIDHAPVPSISLDMPGEDVLARVPLGNLSAGSHAVTVTHQGNVGAPFYFDFLEIAIPTSTLPQIPNESRLALATDWDTNHSMSLAPERTAWLIAALGFRGRVNHYAGALWFYELVNPGQQYASATITFSGTPDANAITTISIGLATNPNQAPTPITHLNLIGDTAVTLAKAFELSINNGYTAIWAQASGTQLTIYARAMGLAGDNITVSTSGSTANLTIELSGATLAGGADGSWLTDLQAMPRINRAARDWHQSFFAALKTAGLDVTASFSMELGNGDPSASAGIAQRYPSQNAVLVNTPALQTNFSPVSASYWQQVYADMAGLQSAAGLAPYLQFGEVQWWYFPDDGSGMPFYDAYTTGAFQAQYGRAMQVIASNDIDPTTVPQEAAFLPGLIGNFTNQILNFVRQTYANCRFEVLYPVDTNAGRLNAVINYPRAAWTPETLNCLKTESFTYTYSRNLEVCKDSINAGIALGFAPSARSHLIGISDASSPWLKEARIAEAAGLESVVLFALDQLCLIGYGLPLSRGARRSARMA